MIELIASPQQTEFGLAKRDTLPKYCLQCDVRFACHGGCPKDGSPRTPDGEPGLHYLCPSYKAFFGHIRPAMEAMCGLLRAGRAPSQITERYARADAKRGGTKHARAARPQMEIVPRRIDATGDGTMARFWQKLAHEAAAHPLAVRAG